MCTTWSAHATCSSTKAASVTSPWTSAARASPRVFASKLSIRPAYVSASKTRISASGIRSRATRTKLLPMKPHPPVTSRRRVTSAVFGGACHVVDRVDEGVTPGHRRPVAARTARPLRLELAGEVRATERVVHRGSPDLLDRLRVVVAHDGAVDPVLRAEADQAFRREVHPVPQVGARVSRREVAPLAGRAGGLHEPGERVVLAHE